MHKILAFLFPVWLFCYSIYSFSQTDPNLVLSSFPPFWKFQLFMWHLGFSNRGWSTIIFVGIVLMLFISYWAIISLIKQGKIPKKHVQFLFIASLFALLPSYPALSHDIYNYLFNAKMVMVYHANPHVQVALDFPNDPWLKFMHNVQTPAPYGYGWTAFSLFPYWLGRGYLQGELLIFRLVMITGLISCLWLIPRIQKVSLKQLALFAFNPLILIEVVGNIHNDIVMMAAVLAGFLLIKNGVAGKIWWKIALGILLFGFSISIKYVSVVLIAAYLASKLIKRISLSHWSVLSLWAPLFTTQSQRFLPWYLTWSLVFLPFLHNKYIKTALIASSITGLLSYLLILYYGEYSDWLLMVRSIILFGGPVLAILIHHDKK